MTPNERRDMVYIVAIGAMVAVAIIAFAVFWPS